MVEKFLLTSGGSGSSSDSSSFDSGGSFDRKLRRLQQGIIENGGVNGTPSDSSNSEDSTESSDTSDTQARLIMIPTPLS